MTLVSQMFPDTKQSYAMTAKLYIVKSLKAPYPMNGNCVADANISFEKIALNKPSLRITGTTVASAAEWGNGQEIAISMSNIATGKMTVTAYSGLTGSQKVTDLLSNVSSIFDINSGTGTYDASKQSTGKLVLNSSAKAGTYRLVFEVKDNEENVLLTVPYYIVVQ